MRRDSYYELFCTLSNNCLGTFDTKAAALDFVRRLAHAQQAGLFLALCSHDGDVLDVVWRG